MKKIYFWMGASVEQGLSSSISFFVMVIGAWLMGKDDFGRMSTMWQMTILGVTLVSSALFPAMIVNLYNSRRRRERANSIILGQAKGIIFILNIIFTISSIFTISKNETAALILSGLSAALSRTALEIDRRWLFAQRKHHKSSLLSILVLLIIILLLTSLHITKNPCTPITYLLICSFSFAFASLIASRSLPMKMGFPTEFHELAVLRKYGRFLKWSFPTTLISILGNISVPFILTISSSPSFIAELNATRTIFGIMQIFIYGFIANMHPHIIKITSSQGHSATVQLTIKWSLWLIAASLFVIIPLILLGKNMHKIIFGNEYGESTNIIITYALLFSILGPSALAGTVLNCINMTRYNLYSAGIGLGIIFLGLHPLSIFLGSEKAMFIVILAEMCILSFRLYWIMKFKK